MGLANFALKKCTGTSAATETTISDKRVALLAIDSTGNDHLANPIPAPRDLASSPAYGMELIVRWENTTAPDSYCQSFKIAGPNLRPDSPTDKVTIYMGTSATGTTPKNTVSSVATVSQHDNYYSEATALAIGVVPGDAKIDAVGEKTNFTFLQPRVAFGALQGELPTQVFMLYWTEV
jgi:hypothetical protein